AAVGVARGEPGGVARLERVADCGFPLPPPGSRLLPPDSPAMTNAIARAPHAVVAALALLVPVAAFAQRTPRTTERATPAAILNPSYDSSLYTNPSPTATRFKALRWRLV